jgi:four helix bundle protein
MCVARAIDLSSFMQDHRRLQVYQVAKQLALQVYAVAAQLPVTERYDLARQLRRAAVSVGSNIAEGCGRSTRPDLARFLDDALGSANEIEFQLEGCVDAGLAPRAEGTEAAETTRRVQQMLTRLILKIRRSEP